MFLGLRVLGFRAQGFGFRYLGWCKIASIHKISTPYCSLGNHKLDDGACNVRASAHA